MEVRKINSFDKSSVSCHAEALEARCAKAICTPFLAYIMYRNSTILSLSKRSMRANGFLTMHSCRHSSRFPTRMLREPYNDVFITIWYSAHIFWCCGRYSAYAKTMADKGRKCTSVKAWRECPEGSRNKFGMTFLFWDKFTASLLFFPGSSLVGTQHDAPFWSSEHLWRQLQQWRELPYAGQFPETAFNVIIPVNQLVVANGIEPSVSFRRERYIFSVAYLI